MLYALIQGFLTGVACWCTLFCLALWLWEAGWIRPHWRRLETNPFAPLAPAFPKRKSISNGKYSAEWLTRMLQRLLHAGQEEALGKAFRTHLIGLLQRRLDDYREDYGWLVEGLQVADLSLGRRGPVIREIQTITGEGALFLVTKLEFDGCLVVSLRSQLGLGMGEWQFQARVGKLTATAVMRLCFGPHPSISLLLSQPPKIALNLDWGQTPMAKLTNLMHYLFTGLLRTRLIYPAWTTVHLRTVTAAGQHLFLLPKLAPLQAGLMLRVLEGTADPSSLPLYVYATLGDQTFRFATLSESPLCWNQTHWFPLGGEEPLLYIQVYSKRRRLTKSVLLGEARFPLGSLPRDQLDHRLLTLGGNCTLRIELFWQSGTDLPPEHLLPSPRLQSPMPPLNWNSLRSALAAMRKGVQIDQVELELEEVEAEGLDAESSDSDEAGFFARGFFMERRHSLPQVVQAQLVRTQSLGSISSRPCWLCHWGSRAVEITRHEDFLKLTGLSSPASSNLQLVVYQHSDLDYVDVSAAHLLFSPLCRPHCLEASAQRLLIYPQGTSPYFAPVMLAWELISRLTIHWYSQHCLWRLESDSTQLYYLADHDTTIHFYRRLQDRVPLPSELFNEKAIARGQSILLVDQKGECRLLDRFFGVAPSHSLSNNQTVDEVKEWTLTLLPPPKTSVPVDDPIWEACGLRVAPTDPLLEFACSYLRRGIVVGRLSLFPGWLVILGRRNGWRTSKFALPLEDLLKAELTTRWMMNRGILLSLRNGEEIFLFGFKREALAHCLSAIIHFQLAPQ